MKKLALILGLALTWIPARATVISQNTSVSFTCTGSTGPFAFTFSVSAANAITVNQNGTVLSPTSYVVAPVNNNYDNGGSVTLNVACPNGQSLTITRTTPLTQSTVFADNMPVPMKSFENGLDKLTEIAQELGATKGGTGSVNSVAVANANGFQGTVLNPNTNPTITISVDSTHVLPTNTGNGSTFLNSAGTYSTLSGGGLPSGSQYQLQTNGGSSLFGHSNAYTDATGNPLTVPGALTGQTTNGTVNSDVVGGVAATLSNALCTTAGCFFGRPQTSTDTATIPNLMTTNQTHGVDYRYGAAANWFYNVGHDASGNDFEKADTRGCFWNSAYSSFLGGRYCKYDSMIYASPGQYVTGEPSQALNHQEYLYAYERSIAQNRDRWFYCYKVGDCAGNYGYLHYRSGGIAGADESVESLALHTLEDPAPYGTVAVGGANATTVKANFTTNAGNQADGAILVDTSQVMATGYLGTQTAPGGNAANTFVSVDVNGSPTTHTVSTGIATLTSACGANTIRNAPASTTCNVTVNSGSFTAGGTNTVCVADWHYPEQAAITATGAGTLTLTLAYSHPSGTQIFQGGGCGGKLAMGFGTTDPSTLHQFTTYFIAGAPTTTTYAYVIADLGGQNGPPTIPLIPQAGASISFVSASRSGNVVTATYINLGLPSEFSSYTPPSGASLQATGFTPSDFNGTITTPITWNPQTSTMTWNQTGPNESVTAQGSLAWQGLNNYVMYCGAETTAVLGVTQNADGSPALDGTLNLEANNCNWTVGDAVVQPNHYAAHATSTFEVAQGTTLPLNNPNVMHAVTTGGLAWSGGYENNYATSDALTDYLGYGGTFLGHVYLNSSGYYATMFNFIHAPMLGGSLLTIGCPPEGCSASNYTYNVASLQGNGGFSQFTYNPANRHFGFNTPQLDVNGNIVATGTGSFGATTVGSLTDNGTGAFNAGLTVKGNYILGYGMVFDSAQGRLENFTFCNPYWNDKFCLGTNVIWDTTANVSANGNLALGEIEASTGGIIAGLQVGIAIPVALPVPTYSGTAGSTSYDYAFYAKTSAGLLTPLSSQGQVTNAAATLSVSNKVTIPCYAAAQAGWPAGTTLGVARVVGGDLYDLGNCSYGGSVIDDGSVVTTTAFPARNATSPVDTGSLSIAGSQYLTGIQGTTGTKALACTGTFTAGHIVAIDASGNCVDGGAAPVAPPAHVQIVLPTTALAANTCSAPATVALTGTTTTSTFTTAFASNPTAVTGYGSSGGLSISLWPTANTVNWSLCNPTASSITPGAMTINVGLGQ